MFLEEGDIIDHEPMGVVEEVGSEVTQIKPGDRVAAGSPVALRGIALGGARPHSRGHRWGAARQAGEAKKHVRCHIIAKTYAFKNITIRSQNRSKIVTKSKVSTNAIFVTPYILNTIEIM